MRWGGRWMRNRTADQELIAPAEALLWLAAGVLSWDAAARAGMSVEGGRKSAAAVRSALAGG